MVHSWAVLTLASINVCLFFCLSRPVMHCSPSSGYSKALQLHYSGQYRDWKVLCVWHAAQLQVNTSRDSVTAVPSLKYVFISPATLHAQSVEVCAASPLLYHITFIPNLYPTTPWHTFHNGAHLCLHPQYSISFLFLYTTNQCCSSVSLYLSGRETSCPTLPE